MKIAKTNYNASNVFAYIGGFLVGWPIRTAIGGGEPNWTLAAIGAGAIVIAIPFSVAGTRHACTAVSIYNNSIKQQQQSNGKLNIELTSNGLGVRLNF
jgi:hypothetical protein